MHPTTLHTDADARARACQTIIDSGRNAPLYLYTFPPVEHRTTGVLHPRELAVLAHSVIARDLTRFARLGKILAETYLVLESFETRHFEYLATRSVTFGSPETHTQWHVTGVIITDEDTREAYVISTLPVHHAGAATAEFQVAASPHNLRDCPGLALGAYAFPLRPDAAVHERHDALLGLPDDLDFDETRLRAHPAAS